MKNWAKFLVVLWLFSGVLCASQPPFSNGWGGDIEAVDNASMTVNVVHRGRMYQLRYDSSTKVKYGRETLNIEDLVGAYAAFFISPDDPELIQEVSVRKLPEDNTKPLK